MPSAEGEDDGGGPLRKTQNMRGYLFKTIPVDLEQLQPRIIKVRFLIEPLLANKT